MGGVTVVGINVPVEIGGAIVMPGDVVLGDRTGLIFIPPHLVEEILEYAEATQLKDEWRKEKFLTGQYKAKRSVRLDGQAGGGQEMDEYVKRNRRAQAAAGVLPIHGGIRHCVAVVEPRMSPNRALAAMPGFRAPSARKAQPRRRWRLGCGSGRAACCIGGRRSA
ncbi:MAG: hypothetical protein R2748_31505 [Bryobacterales bacterium]